MSRISRRDFLKLSAAFFGGAGLTFMGSHARLLRDKADSTKPNFIILVLDAMSARNLSIYGYVRKTTPFLERFLNRATVYHSHYAGGNFTTPGTATLLTGLYPWTHRATALGGIVERSLVHSSLFSMIGDGYYRQAYTQNQLAYLLLGQFGHDLDNLMSRRLFALHQNAPMIEERFANDYPVAAYTIADFLGISNFYVDPASLSLGLIDMLSIKQSEIHSTPEFPKGYPFNYYTYFRIEDILAGLSDSLNQLAAAQSPFLAYYHLLPPHFPYNPKKEFLNLFLNDGLTFPKKPFHPLSAMRKPQDKLDRLRLTYDSFIANIDYEVDAFIQTLDQTGVLDNSYLIITSDHGETFERGEYGHGTRLLYDAVCHVPLLISAPGQTGRRNVTSLTSNVDLVPTILSLAGQTVPSHIEGRLLPEFGGSGDPERSVFTIFAQENSAFLPLTHSVMSMNKDTHHLVYTRGYPGEYEDKVELYDLADDPEELRDLAKEDLVTTRHMKEELLDLSNAADLPFRRK